jgi:hypothetical protein
MHSATSKFSALALAVLLAQCSLSAQNDGYQKAGNSNNNNPQGNNYATPGDQAQVSNDDDDEEDALRGGNFVIGSGVGYVNSVTTIQIDNGSTVQKGGNTGFQLHLTPTIGYFVSRNFVLGLGMDYLVSSSKDNSDNTNGSPSTSDTKLLFGPYTRLYFPFAGDQAFFIGGVYGYGKSETEISDGTDTQLAKTQLMTFGIGPGYSIFSHGRVSLETQVKYNYGISRSDLRVDNANQSTRTLTEAWDFVVGLHFYFSRNR